METDKPLDTSSSEQVLPDVAKNQFHVTLIVAITLFVAIIILVTLFFIFFHSSSSNGKFNQPSKVQLSTHNQQIANVSKNEVTKDTVIAKSLEVPPLYPHAQWTNVTNASDSAGLNRIWSSPDLHAVSFTGHYWSTTIHSIPNADVEVYYYYLLQKKGWFGKEGVSNLIFKDITLSPQSEGGACSGIDSFVGYKDGFVRIITLSEQITPCNPPGMTDDTSFLSFTLFVSDPMPLNQIIPSKNN